MARRKLLLLTGLAAGSSVISTACNAAIPPTEQASAPEVMPTLPSSATVTQQSTLTWSFTSQRPINQKLLEGAKHLLQHIYHYSDAKPDYLPSSYNRMNTNATSYVVHAVHPTQVHWNQEEQSIYWSSAPTREPLKGWSAIVLSAGRINTSIETSCHTDCSGFITSLFAYVNCFTPAQVTQQVTQQAIQQVTQFKHWKALEQIPEAGCFDPMDGCQRPNPLNYYRFFHHSEFGFQGVSLEDVEPGDLIAYANTKSSEKDSGHIMLIAAVAPYENGSKLVVVIDQTGSPHTEDSRGQEQPNGGVGMGIAKLSSTNGMLEFFWSVNANQPEEGRIALGRSL